MAARTLLARAGGVWMWPGISLTETRGAACDPVAADVARFWISRLHGPETNDSSVLRCLAAAAQKLSGGDEVGAQNALDASGLTRRSSDGAVLMRAVAGSLGIGPLDLPWVDGPRLWRAEDIAAHLPLFKDYAPTAALLAKAGAWDESKHPHWHAGRPAIPSYGWCMETCASRLHTSVNGALCLQDVGGRQSCLQRTYSPPI